ncbi:MAG: O-antigen ligase family protein [Aliivibrio sp.]|nr:O-antigen ligase family protein [Aliivibrio sp.]
MSRNSGSSTKRHKFIFISLLVAVIGFSFFNHMRGPQVNDIEQRLMNDISQVDSKTTSTGLRLGMWESGMRSFIDSPILGQGYVQREFFNNQLVDDGVIIEQLRIKRGKGKGSLHNEFINAMAKKGIIGLIAVLSIYLVPFYFFVYFLRKNEANFYPALAGISFIGTFAIVGLTEAALMQTGSSLMYIFSIIFVFLSLDRTETSLENEVK